MKGKDTFSAAEINKLEQLIILRNNSAASAQKGIRQKMRNIGFYGKDDWSIIDLQLKDLHSLIKSGKIKVIGSNLKPVSISTKILNLPEKQDKTSIIGTKKTLDMKGLLESFKLNRFDPQTDNVSKVDDSPGNYILCLKENVRLPTVSNIPKLTSFEGLNVIYTGIAGGSLRTRDYRQHFKGNNAGKSTLRKSLGVLFGYKQIPRDKDPNSGKTKFNEKDEMKLSEWMHSNLIMYFLPTSDFKSIEINLIKHFNPPLNLKDNKNLINIDFRKLLSNLRSSKK